MNWTTVKDKLVDKLVASYNSLSEKNQLRVLYWSFGFFFCLLYIAVIEYGHLVIEYGVFLWSIEAFRWVVLAFVVVIGSIIGLGLVAALWPLLLGLAALVYLFKNC
jgi:hypothetical protein